MTRQLGRGEALALFLRYNHTDSLIRHALAVESVMRHFAAVYREDPDKWGVIGLLHDLDYEMYPEQHCAKSAEILAAEGVDPSYIHAVCSHGYGICSDVEPAETMEKVLFAIDELTGLINAAALMRPSKSVLDMEVKSVLKKFKTPSFAAGVDRALIEKGAADLGMELPELIGQTILGMREAAEAIGLKGNL